MTIFAELLSEKIESYLKASGLSLADLARQIGFPLSTLRRLVRGGYGVGNILGEAYIILKFVAPAEAESIIMQWFPELMDEFARTTTAPSKRYFEAVARDDLKKDLNIAQAVFQSVHHYRIYSWILAGIWADDLKKRFGRYGLSILGEFTAAGVAKVDEDGRISPIQEDTTVLNNKDLLRQAELNIKLTELNPKHAWTWVRMSNVTPEAAHEIKSVLQDARKRLWEILEDESATGPIPLHITIINGYEDEVVEDVQDLEARINSYKKAYDLDEVTARKIAMVAHDMRGPLDYLMNYIEKIEARYQDDADYHLARSAMSRVNSMVLCFKDLNSSAIIVREKGVLYLDECRDLAESYSIRYEKSFEYIGLLEFHANLDAEKVDRALQNLMINAFEAARSAVMIEVGRRDSDFFLKVSDDGPGVSEASISKLFQQGFTEGKENGTGLGLAFVKHVAHGHGGTVSYERSDKGWTTFTMTIPHAFMEGLLDEIPGNKVELHPPTEKDARLQRALSNRPVLLVLLDRGCWQKEKTIALKQALPEYEISESYNAITHAWFICLGPEEDHQDIIMEQKLNAVWMPSESSLASPGLLDTIQGMAMNELKKFKKLRAEFRDHLAPCD